MSSACLCVVGDVKALVALLRDRFSSVEPTRTSIASVAVVSRDANARCTATAHSRACVPIRTAIGEEGGRGTWTRPLNGAKLLAFIQRGIRITLLRLVAMTFGVVAAFMLAFTVLGWPLGSSAVGLDIVVTTTDDINATDCSLRDAITAANTDTTVGGCIADDTSDLIRFELGNSPSITVLTPLPDITDGVTIDGKTGGADRVELYGRTNANGLSIKASNVVIRNLVINNFGKRGIRIYSGSYNLLIGNFIGTDSPGTGAVPNTAGGIEVDSPNNTIGGLNGTSPGGSCTGDCNLISGNDGPGIELTSGAGGQAPRC